MEAHVVTLIREKLTPATVGVQGSSGVIVSADGVVACAAHTVGGLGTNGEATVTMSDGRKHPAKVLAVFREMDTAILRIAAKGPFVHVEPLRDDAPVTPGSWVIHVGYPHTYAKGGPGFARLGRVVERVRRGENRTVFLDDVGVAGGDSGSPVFDLQGRLIGVVNTGGRGRRGGSHFTAIAPITADAVWEKVLSGKAETVQPYAPTQRHVFGPGMKHAADAGIPDRCLDVLKEVASLTGDSVALIAGPGDVRRLGAVCSADGMIVTKGGDWPTGTSVTCGLHGGRELTGAVVATDRRHDLALVVVRATDLDPVEWVTTGPPSVGQWLVSPGPDRTAIAAGIVGAVNVDGVGHATAGGKTMNVGGGVIRVGSTNSQGTGDRSYPKLVWHTAWLEAAELGGPLVDLDGRAVGIAIERPWHVASYMVPAAVIREFLRTHADAAVPPGRRTSADSAAPNSAP